MSCPATQEAVIERELEGEWGCPLCGRTAEHHRPESTVPAFAIGLIPEHVTDYATTCPTCEAAADRPCDHFPVQMLAGAPRFVLPSRPEHVTATEER